MIDESQFKDGDYYYHVKLPNADNYPKKYIVLVCNFISKAPRTYDLNMVFATYKEARAKAKELNRQLNREKKELAK